MTAVTVYQELACGKATVAMRFTPAAKGRFDVSFKAPAGAQAGIYRLASRVARSPGTKHGFSTYSLPLPVILG
jgi:hypothetical protein